MKVQINTHNDKVLKKFVQWYVIIHSSKGFIYIHEHQKKKVCGGEIYQK